MNSEKESFACWFARQDPVEINEAAEMELKRMLEIPGTFEPDRGDLDKIGIEWRYGKPSYTLANLAFLKGKTQNHKKGSLEMIVENAVKTVRFLLLISC
jgi:hypothetical protein